MQTALQFDMPHLSGAELRDIGIKKAVDHAEVKNENWSDVAYDFLKKYITGKREFMAEDFRYAAEGIVPEPPSLRAYGGIISRAAKDGLIFRIGYSQVKNPRAHMANAAVWRVRNITD